MALACELADDAEAAWRDLDNWTEIPRDLHDPEYEEYQFHAEEVERTTLSYRHALQRLWRASSAIAMLDACPAQLAAGMPASETNSEPCSCGGGRIALIPWALHREAWGFCSCDAASWHVLQSRERISQQFQQEIAEMRASMGWHIAGAAQVS